MHNIITHDSYWYAGVHSAQDYPSLSTDLTTDVVVIGGGITGLTTALSLLKEGKQVVVLEAGTIGSGTTGATSAQLDTVPDQGASELIGKHGLENSRLVTKARMDSILLIETWSKEFQIDCEFERVPGYFYSEDESRFPELRDEFHAMSQLGLGVTLTSDFPMPFPIGGVVRIDNQARFHPLKYLSGLAKAFVSRGGLIFENTRALPPHGGAPLEVKTDGGNVVSCEQVAVCTHSAFLGISMFDLRVAPYQSYVIAVRTERSCPEGIFWDDADPYHYFRRADPGVEDLVLIGGADHKTGQSSDELGAWSVLEEYAEKRFGVREIVARWSGEYFEPDDGLPYVGKVPMTSSIFMATGFLGTGLTLGTVAGKLMADQIVGHPNLLSGILSTSRVSAMASSSNLFFETANVAWHYVADRFKGEVVYALSGIERGQGELIIFDGQQIAAYRDEEGELKLLSPACTHAGCHVHWNDAEKTWDCPCHGGRYAPDGTRLYGPPPRDLQRLDVKSISKGLESRTGLETKTAPRNS